MSYESEENGENYGENVTRNIFILLSYLIIRYIRHKGNEALGYKKFTRLH